MSNFEKSITSLAEGSRMRPLFIPPDVVDFLSFILTPKELSHKADHADFIRNEVLREIRRTIHYAQERGGY